MNLFRRAGRHPRRAVGATHWPAAFRGVLLFKTLLRYNKIMNIRWATDDEVRSWDAFILKSPDHGNIFQSREFADQKRMGGWTPRYLTTDSGLFLTILEKSVPCLGKLWYAPKGPGVSDMRQLDTLLPALRDFARSQGVFLLKIEPELRKNPETMADLLKLGLIGAAPIQPNFSTVTLDISDDLETVMDHLNQKGRHAIRRAERDGVTVRRVPSSDENCRLMYGLLSETAAGSFRIRSYEYYHAFWQRFSDSGLGQLFFAYVDDIVVAGAYALVFGEKSTYKDGASIRERTAYGASHYLQWQVITWAKEHGAMIHDFCGAPPANEINNPQHPHYGIGRFKTSFNKEVTDYVGVFDVVICPGAYHTWQRYGEKLVRKIYDFQHHESWY